ncbi:MAG TPA: hypothetical protein VK698_30020 [Kofleriaceae bacterium]|nr:hypothetical protein [Kofleriaceae bacterium]
MIGIRQATPDADADADAQQSSCPHGGFLVTLTTLLYLLLHMLLQDVLVDVVGTDSTHVGHMGLHHTATARHRAITTSTETLARGANLYLPIRACRIVGMKNVGSKGVDPPDPWADQLSPCATGARPRPGGTVAA